MLILLCGLVLDSIVNVCVVAVVCDKVARGGSRNRSVMCLQHLQVRPLKGFQCICIYLSRNYGCSSVSYVRQLLHIAT